MLSEKMQKALNSQVNAELYSAYLYQSMSAWSESEGLPGFANWMNVQAQEEHTHAMKIYAYINDRGGRVTLEAIDRPQGDWDSPLAMFEDTLAHEQKVTGLINDLVDLALSERDHATNAMLQWFVTEQVEEEKTAGDLIQQIKLLKDAPNGIFMLDRELAQRVFVPPTAVGGEA